MTSAAANAVIVLAHGSRADTANEAHVELCATLVERTGRAVRPAFLELASPSFAEAVARLADEGATVVEVLPYFLHPGRHDARDVPALIDAARTAHPDVDFVALPLFGADPGVVDLLAGRLRT